MQYDLVIRGGTIVDGSGMPRFVADVGVANGRIATIGRIREPAREVIDAEGQIVSPGFVDGHTHYDAQVWWDPLATSSCYHGVTSVVMGNCGFTLAPVRNGREDLVLANLERAEDIPAQAMKAGIDFRWETFPEYLDALDAAPKGINFANYIGHSALRTFVMGERAFTDEATEDDLRLMRQAVAEAVGAGAIGFSTSRSANHTCSDGRPVASVQARWEEVQAIVGAMGELNAGVFELAGEGQRQEPEKLRDYHIRLRDLAVASGRPVTWGTFDYASAPDNWRRYLALLDETAAAGGRMFAQVHSRMVYVVLSFETRMPFNHLPAWREFRDLPLDQKKKSLEDPATRARLVSAAKALSGPKKPDYDRMLIMRTAEAPYPAVSAVAEERGVHPVDVIVDEALTHDLKQFFLGVANNENDEHNLEMMRHPRSVVTFSDSGAHVSLIADSSLQTHVFSHWVRRKQALTLEEAVRMLTFETASCWGIRERGLLREGYWADLLVFDADAIAPEMPEVAYDLPSGARRLRQTAAGIHATVVNGEVLLRDGEHTGALPGRLLRGPLAA